MRPSDHSDASPSRDHEPIAPSLVEANGELSFGPPKTRRSRRTIPLPRRVATVLREHLDYYVAPDPGALVFTGSKGAPLRRAGFRRWYWLPALRRVGLDGLKVHELRHTFVALWVAAGRNPKRFQSLPVTQRSLSRSIVTSIYTKRATKTSRTASMPFFRTLLRPQRGPRLCRCFGRRASRRR